MRGIADDVPLKPWLEQHIWPREGRFVSAEFVFDGTLLGAAEMLRGGITCCNDMYFYPDAAARAYEIAGMRALLGMPVLDFPTPYAADADAYLTRGLAARDAFKHVPLLSVRAGAARALHGERRNVEQDRDVRAPARFADSNASRGNARRSRRRAVRDGHHAVGAARSAGRDGSQFHRDSRGACHGSRHCDAGAARLPCRALPGVEHEARERHRAGDGAARAGRQRGAGQRRRRVQQSSRSLFRDAAREPARQGDDAATPPRCRPPRRCKWPR